MPGGTREPDGERIQVGAFAAHRARLQHVLDVALAASRDLGVAIGVDDDPLINRARLVDVGRGTRRDPVRGRFDDAVGSGSFGGTEIQVPLGLRQRLRIAGLREIDETIARRHAADNLRRAIGCAGPRHAHHLGSIRTNLHLRGVAVRTGAVIRYRAYPVTSRDRRQRNQGLRDVCGCGKANLRRDFECAPFQRPGFKCEGHSAE